MNNYNDVRVDEIALNVRQFGAVGDGETDDTQSIQNAIDEAAGFSGQVTFPPESRPPPAPPGLAGATASFPARGKWVIVTGL